MAAVASCIQRNNVARGVRMLNDTFPKIASNHFIKIVLKITYGGSLGQKVSENLANLT
jgi:hypothetical protein